MLISLSGRVLPSVYSFSKSFDYNKFMKRNANQEINDLERV
jgi:hypothetical protein